MASSKQAVSATGKSITREKRDGLALGLTSTINMKKSDDLNEFNEDEELEGLFSLDEEQPMVLAGKMPKRYNCDYESDAENESNEHRSDGISANEQAEDVIRGGIMQAGALAYGTSLPVTIPAGRFWPPKDAVDSIKEDGLLSSDDENTEGRVKTLLPQRIHKDLYREIQAQARSIQAADDPERIFGERPQRRRYQTGESSPVTPRALAPHAPHENAVVIVAASVSSHT